MPRNVWLLAIVVLLLAACGPSPTTATDLGAAPSADPSPTTATDLSAAPTADPSPTAAPRGATGEPPTQPPADGDADDTRQAADAADDGDLPGEPAPWARALNTRAEAGVIGVEAGDVLNVRVRPGADQPIIDRLAPLERGFRLTGRARTVGSSAWYEITAGDVTGWVNSFFVALPTAPFDITDSLRDAGVEGTAGDLRDLAEQVLGGPDMPLVWGPVRAADLASGQQYRVVISDGPTVGDRSQITVDMVDTFDDSIAAVRHTIRAEPDPTGGFSLRAVEVTNFCHTTRGVDEVCV